MGVFFGVRPPLSSGPQTISIPITNADDDLFYRSDLAARYLGTESISFSYDNRVMVMRFPGINVPQGSTIQNSYIKLITSVATGANPQTSTIYGIDIDDASVSPSTYTWAQFNALDKTTSNVSWSAPGSKALGSVVNTDDISSIIQEIVNRPGWSSGNALIIRINGTGNQVRQIAAVENTSYDAPELYITYI